MLVERHTSSVEITVTDTGVGIATVEALELLAVVASLSRRSWKREA